MVGIISVWALAKLLRRPFYIKWTKEDIRSHLDYAQWDAENPEIAWPPYIRAVVAMDAEAALALGKQMAGSHNPFPAPAVKFVLNQEIIRHVLKNPRFRGRQSEYEAIMLAAWGHLYTDILKPTPQCWSDVEGIVPPDYTKRLVGIQIRGGDIYMNTHDGERHVIVPNIDAELPGILLGVRNHLVLEGWNPNECGIFITSDIGKKVFTAAKEVFGTDNVLYNDKPVNHLDWCGDAEVSTSWKVIVDNVILSKRCHRLYITGVSNYGRVAALSANHSDIFDVFSCMPLQKRDLFAKL